VRTNKVDSSRKNNPLEIKLLKIKNEKIGNIKPRIAPIKKLSFK
tara:strand:- start:832 stop:963 length:132 start_codon:yes stop_codon:yes gene_type:complete